MKLKIAIHLLIIFFSSSLLLNAQHKCLTAEKHDKVLKTNKIARENNLRLENYTKNYIENQAQSRTEASDLVTIPVVIHVIYNTPEQNISEAQINSQIEILNNDFAGKNSDSTNIPAAFKSIWGKTNIRFVMANRDPSGNTTTGITRTSTTVTAFVSDHDHVKSDATGGKTAWDVSKYLNIWVCSIDGTTLGYATLPGDLATNGAQDGVVCRYNAFGIANINDGDNTLGRTMTHEVGHWLNLGHIWGDAVCGDDNVSDTPSQSAANQSNCPTFPHNANTTCTTGANGEMFMNYMDYVNDNCMNMFSAGQATRMYAALNSERASIKTSTGYVLGSVTPPVATTPENSTALTSNDKNSIFTISPNPSNGVFTFNNSNLQNTTLTIKDVLGNIIIQIEQVELPLNLDLSNQKSGVYFASISSRNKSELKKLVLLR